MKHKIKINEAVEENIFSQIFESFVPNYQLTLMVKEFLDRNFTSDYEDDVKEGNPVLVPVFIRYSSNPRRPIQSYKRYELIEYLDDVLNFEKYISDETDRKKFLEHVATCWLNGTISKEGLTPKNYI